MPPINMFVRLSVLLSVCQSVRLCHKFLARRKTSTTNHLIYLPRREGRFDVLFIQTRKPGKTSGRI